MILNPNVNIDTSRKSFDKFAPDEGYALWRDNEKGNLDENGQPISYQLVINSPKALSEDLAIHIWAKAIGIEAPIPYNGKMTLESGKYYTQEDITYLCIKDTNNPVYHPLSDLIGVYVEKI